MPGGNVGINDFHYGDFGKSGVRKSECFQKLKPTFFAFNIAFFDKLSKLIGHGTSFYTKIVSQLLPVKRNGKFCGLLLLCLKQEIGHQLFSGSTLGCKLYFLMERKASVCNKSKQIAVQTVMELTGIAAGSKGAFTIEKKNGTVS